jgi:hypothetical protein
MPADALALYATVILLFPMAFFSLSTPAFLLVRLEIPEVGQLLRGLFNGYFLTIAIAGSAAMVLFAVVGRAPFAFGDIAIAAFVVAVRRWLLRRVDAELQAREAGGTTAACQLRVLHVKSMLLNAVQLAIVVACGPLVL